MMILVWIAQTSGMWIELAPPGETKLEEFWDDGYETSRSLTTGNFIIS